MVLFGGVIVISTLVVHSFWRLSLTLRQAPAEAEGTS
jgi:hypothetical protein